MAFLLWLNGFSLFVPAVCMHVLGWAGVKTLLVSVFTGRQAASVHMVT
jgi:hypothetical protein